MYSLFLIWLLKRVANVPRFVQIDFADSDGMFEESKAKRNENDDKTNNFEKKTTCFRIDFLSCQFKAHWPFDFVLWWTFTFWTNGRKNIGIADALFVRQTNKNKWQIMTLQQFEKNNLHFKLAIIFGQCCFNVVTPTFLWFSFWLLLIFYVSLAFIHTDSNWNGLFWLSDFSMCSLFCGDRLAFFMFTDVHHFYVCLCVFFFHFCFQQVRWRRKKVQSHWPQYRHV